jgi:autoinducer 2 (AI-2) kinase
MVLDAGSGGGKCLIYDSKGNQLASSFQPWLRSEWSPALGWRQLVSSIRKVFSYPDVSPEQIVSISSTSMREEFVLVDNDENEYFIPFGKPILPEAILLGESWGEEMYESSGHWPSAFMPAAKLVWFKKNRLREFEQISSLMMISDWMLYKLSDESVVEPSGACETCLFDLEKADWSYSLLSKVDLPREIFPNVRENGEVIGYVTERAAKETGLIKGTPVVVGGADTQCGLIGSACGEDGQTAAVAGTTTPVQMVLPKPIIDPQRRLWTNCHVIPKKWILESNAGATGWIYRWVRDALGDLEVLASQTIGIDAYSLLDRQVEKVPPGSNGVLAYLGSRIMNVSRRERLPTGLFGLTAYSREGVTGKGEIARAAMESTCFAVRANSEQLEEVSGIPIREIMFCGGASRSRLWVQMQSDILNIPVKVPLVKEATAVGAAILGGVGVDLYDSIVDGFRRVVKWEPLVEPGKDVTSSYDKYYHRWFQGYRRLQALTKP